MEELVDGLNFKIDNLKYRKNRIIETKKELIKIADSQLDTVREGLSQSDWNIDLTDESLDELILPGRNMHKSNGLIEIQREINSDELFFEFEAFLSEISSFIDYFNKFLRIYFQQLSTKKKKFSNVVRSVYKDTLLINFVDDFDRWIQELLGYRDHITHISSINSRIKIRASNSGGRVNVSMNKGIPAIHMSSEAPIREVLPIYIPHKIKFKHLIEEDLGCGEINYDEDFYILEEYIEKLDLSISGFIDKFISILKIL